MSGSKPTTKRHAVSVGDIVSGGPLLLALPIAAAAGVLSFASPCMLPLVPGYLSYITGLSGADLADPADPAGLAGPTAGRPSGQVTGSRPASSPLSPRGGLGSTTGVLTRGPAPGQVAACESPLRARGRVPLGAALFVLGFTAVFVAYGSAFGTFGALLRRHERAVEQVLEGRSPSCWAWHSPVCCTGCRWQPGSGGRATGRRPAS